MKRHTVSGTRKDAANDKQHSGKTDGLCQRTARLFYTPIARLRKIETGFKRIPLVLYHHTSSPKHTTILFLFRRQQERSSHNVGFPLTLALYA